MRGHCTSCVSEFLNAISLLKVKVGPLNVQLQKNTAFFYGWLMSPRVEHCPRHQDEILLVQERVSPVPQFEGCKPVATQRPMMQWMQYEMVAAGYKKSLLHVATCFFNCLCHSLKLFETDS